MSLHPDIHSVYTKMRTADPSGIYADSPILWVCVKQRTAVLDESACIMANRACGDVISRRCRRHSAVSNADPFDIPHCVKDEK